MQHKLEKIGRRAAILAGSKRYFTGEPCLHGHVAERFTTSARCVRCAGISLRAARKKNPEAIAEKARLYRRANSQRISARVRAHYAANIEKCRARGRADEKIRRERRKEELAARRKQQYAANPDPSRARNRKSYQKNIEARRAGNARWAKENPDKVNAINQARRARKRMAAGRYTPDDIKAIFALQKGRCAYCRTSFKRAKPTVDHIQALAAGGSNFRSNLQLLCRPCNSSKQDRDPLDHAQTLGLLL